MTFMIGKIATSVFEVLTTIVDLDDCNNCENFEFCGHHNMTIALSLSPEIQVGSICSFHFCANLQPHALCAVS